MIKKIIEKWNKNKDKLEKYFSTHNQEEYDTYKKILEKVVKYILVGFNEFDDLDDIKIKEVSFGGYQGIDIFLITPYFYPDLTDIIYTHNYYGSCCGCDTLQRIQFESNNYGEGKPTKQQVKDYMTLSLHLIQNMRFFKGSD